MSTRLAALVVFAVALLARAATAAGIGFPVPEDSAYYVAVARNLATGHGLVTDALWSYATPPLAVPRPAFDLWQPLASFLAAPFMLVLGPSLAAAQVPSVLVGAALAPVAWALAQSAARELGLPEPRAAIVAFASGLLVALTPLLVVQSAEPDSSALYAFLALAACALMPRALAERGPRWRVRALLGIAVGLAYLARSDAVYLIAAYVVLAAIGIGRGSRPLRTTLLAVAPTLAVAAVVVLPWLLRQSLTWDESPLGQLVENVYSVRQTDIYAWSSRPSLESYLAIGPGQLLSMRLDALIGDVLLLLVGAFPAVPIGAVTLLVARKLVGTRALRPLAIVATLTFAVDVLVFPVAGRAGLWAHGAGPAIVLLAIAAGFGLDAVVARVGAARAWRTAAGPFSRAGFIAPLAVLIVSTPLVGLAGTLEQQRSADTAAAYRALATVSARWDAPPGRAIVTDHPMWLAEALDHPALALPREQPVAVVDLMRHFGAVALVVRDDDLGVVATVLGLAAYRDAAGRTCFPELPAVAPFRAFGFACATETALGPGP